MVFAMDCYTMVWAMQGHDRKEVFPCKSRQFFFNTRFVCVKYDMEKGEARNLPPLQYTRLSPLFGLFVPTGEVQTMDR